MAKPVVKTTGTAQEFYWQEQHIYAIIDRFKEHHDGRITAEVIFKTDLPDMSPHIAQTQLNLLSARSKKDLIKDLNDQFHLEFASIVEQLCVISLVNYRRGEPVREVCSEDNVPEPEFLIEPLIYKGKPTLLYGEGGTGKSNLAMALALCTELPFYDNPLHLVPEKATSLYLDYESDELEFKRRLSALNRPQFSQQETELTAPVTGEETVRTP